MNLKPFDLLFYKGNSFISKLIKEQTNSKYSHVAIALDDKHVAEIDTNIKLCIRHISYKSKDVDVYRLKNDISDEQQEQMKNYIYSTLNSKYDFIEILDYMIYRIFKKRITSNPNKFICSGWVNECFKVADIELSSELLVSPQDLISDKMYIVD